MIIVLVTMMIIVLVTMMIIVLVTMVIIVLATMMILVCDGHPDHDDDDISLQCNVRQKHMFDSGWEPTFVYTMRIIRWLSFTSLTSTNSNNACIFYCDWSPWWGNANWLIWLSASESLKSYWPSGMVKKKKKLDVWQLFQTFVIGRAQLITYNDWLWKRKGLIRRERTRLKFRTTHMRLSINNFWPDRQNVLEDISTQT